MHWFADTHLVPRLRKLPGVQVVKVPKSMTLGSAIRLSNRVGADYHLEVHSDASGGRWPVKGGHCIVYPSSSKAARWGALTAARMHAVDPDFKLGLSKRSDLGALRLTNAVALLVEVDGHDSVEQARQIRTNAARYAAAMVEAFAEMIGVTPPSPSPVTPTAPAKVRGPFPLPVYWKGGAGHWYGIDDRTARSHSGARERDRAAVRQIQRVVGVTDDGDYGPITARAVARWQLAHKLASTGRVDAATWEKMR